MTTGGDNIMDSLRWRRGLWPNISCLLFLCSRQGTGCLWKNISQPGSTFSWVKAHTRLMVLDSHPWELNRNPAQLKARACLLAQNPGLLDQSGDAERATAAGNTERWPKACGLSTTSCDHGWRPWWTRVPLWNGYGFSDAAFGKEGKREWEKGEEGVRKK